MAVNSQEGRRGGLNPAGFLAPLNDAILTFEVVSSTANPSAQAVIVWQSTTGVIGAQTIIIPAGAAETLLIVTFQIPAGAQLLSVLGVATGAVKYGELYAIALVSSSSSSTGGVVLFQGYLTTSGSLTWPLACPQANNAGIVPEVQTVTIPNPAAGADFSLSIPGLGCSQLIAFKGTLVTSAAVANRIVQTQVSVAGGAAIVLGREATGQTASNTIIHYFSDYDISLPPIIAGTDAFQAIIPNFGWPRSSVFSTFTQNLQAADQWSLGQLIGRFYRAI